MSPFYIRFRKTENNFISDIKSMILNKFLRGKK